MSNVVTLAAGAATVELAPSIGGAIAAFRWRGHDVLRPTPGDAREAADVRRFACYPLVPYSNRVADARLDLAGGSFVLARNMGEHPHAIHGVGWQRPWSLDRATASEALMTIRHDAHGSDAASWPFAFEAQQAIALTACDDRAALTLTLSIRNTDTRAFPFGLGWHPFFPRDRDTVLGFAAAAMWETDATCLPTSEAAIVPALGFDPPRALGDTTRDNVFTGWTGRASLAWPATGMQVRIEADRMLEYLVVYVPPHRDYLAVEPVTHMTDAFNRSARGATRTGTRNLPPGEARSCTMRIVVSPLAR